MDRAKHGLSKLGLQKIWQCLSSTKPWASLKEVASRPQFSFQWIRAEELQDQIRRRAASKFKVQPSSKKTKGSTRQAGEQATPIVPDPTHLQLLPNTFAVGNTPVCQVPFTDVKKDGKGLAFSTVAEVSPFLRQGEVISEHALAVLTVTVVPTDLVNSVTCVNLRFPVHYRGTGEPILLFGTLVQLGKQQVARILGPSSSVEALETQTLRVTLFKDAWPGSWEEVTRQPFRSILQHVPTLQLCRASGCGDSCPHYHAAVDETIEHLVVDLWARAWHRLDGRYCKADQAEFWSALVRVPRTAQDTLQRASGTAGVFLEPRSPCGKMVDVAFQVVWLQETSVDEALHKCRTTEHAIAITRIQRKFGIRFATAHFESGFKALRPKDSFIPVKVQKVWKFFPLPYGTQRSGLQKCLGTLNWEAKVLQQTGSSNAGATWEVGAEADPPSSVLRISDQDVVVTFLRDASKATPKEQVIASSSTKDHLKTGCSGARSKLDPWLQNDPWSAYRSNAPAASSDRVQQLEQRLHVNLAQTASALRAEMNAGPNNHDAVAMEEDDAFKLQTETRFASLEANMTELRTHQGKLEGWLKNVAQSSSESQAQLVSVTENLHQQQEDIGALRSELATSTQSTQASMVAIQNDVREEMQKGFTHITALLEKRSRTDRSD